MTSDTEQTSPRTEWATTFGAAAGDYDRYRVGAPEEVVDRFLPAGMDAVLDLGAGTGAMTRRLVERARQVYAVDPDERMTELLARGCPDVDVRQGTGEAVPLPDACVDAVVVASAWHWMDPEAAIPEVARVLRPGGALCIVWNRRDHCVPWVAELDAHRLEVSGGDDWVGGRIRHYLEEPWLPAGAPLTDIEISALPWTAAMTEDELVGALTTYQHYITAAPERQREIVRQLTEYVRGDERIVAHEDESGEGRAALIHLPMVCNVWRATLA